MLGAGTVLMLALSACGAGEGSAVAILVSDSAGVTIIDNLADPVPDAGWRVSDVPVVSIGVIDGAPEYQLDQVMGSLRLEDGTIVVANGGTSEIRFYDPEGRFIRSAGRDGEGPGEFRALGQVHRWPGDSLVATDWRLRRISVFDEEGRFGRSFLVQTTEDGLFPRPVAPLGRAFLVTTTRAFGMESRTGIHYDTLPYIRFGAAGEPLDTVGLFPGTESFVRNDGQRMNVTALGFGRATQVRTSGDRFYVATQSAHEVRVYDADGSLERVIRLPGERRAVTDLDIRAFRERRLEQVTDENWRRMTELLLREMPLPERMPAHGSIEVDAEGAVWVQEYRSPADAGPVTWTVFAPEGNLIGSIRIPERFRILEIGSDYVLGVQRDEFDVEYVHLYRLTRR